MSMEEQIKPIDWAKLHDVRVDLVMKLLRDVGVTVRTQKNNIMSKIIGGKILSLMKLKKHIRSLQERLILPLFSLKTAYV